jgi:hypothetical protein
MRRQALTLIGKQYDVDLDVERPDTGEDWAWAR